MSKEIRRGRSSIYQNLQLPFMVSGLLVLSDQPHYHLH